MYYAYLILTESTFTRGDSDDDWEEKEASRTISVKFTEDVSEAKEVSFCCNFRTFTFKRSQRKLPLCIHDSSSRFRNHCRSIRNRFTNVFSRQRAYLALSSIVVALE